MELEELPPRRFGTTANTAVSSNSAAGDYKADPMVRKRKLGVVDEDPRGLVGKRGRITCRANDRGDCSRERDHAEAPTRGVRHPHLCGSRVLTEGGSVCRPARKAAKRMLRISAVRRADGSARSSDAELNSARSASAPARCHLPEVGGVRPADSIGSCRFESARASGRCCFDDWH